MFPLLIFNRSMFGGSSNYSWNVASTLTAITQIYGPTDVQMIEYLGLLLKSFYLEYYSGLL